MRFTVQISWSGNDRDNQKFSMATMMSASMADREKTAEQLETLNLDNVKAAQAQGDFDVLAERGRRLVRIHLTDVDAGLVELAAAANAALETLSL